MHRPRWWLRSPTVEQIMEQALAAGVRMREQPVAYYREQAAQWQRHRRGWWYLMATLAAIALIINSRWLTGFYVLLSFWIGQQYRRASAERTDALRKAWEIENEETLNGMREGGLLASPRDVLEVMRDADPPPGISRKAWREQHEDMIKRWDAEHG